MGSKEEHDRLVKDCLTELALMGFAAWENPRRAVQVNGRWVSLTKSGRGDIHVILPLKSEGKQVGVHGEVECKTGKSTQSKDQRIHMRVVRRSGGVYILARDPAEMRSQIEKLGFAATL